MQNSGEGVKTDWLENRIMFPSVTISTCFYPRTVVLVNHLW